jgi:hypothetical protein
MLLDPPGSGGPELYLRVRPGAGDDILTITTPAAGQPLAADGIITVAGGALPSGTSNRFAIVEVHVGSAEGPMIFEFGVRVFRFIRVKLAPHNVSINGTATNITQAQLNTMLRGINAIYRPVGIYFRWEALPAAATVRTGYRLAGQVTYNGDSANAHPVPGSAPPVNVPANDYSEFNGILQQNRVAGAINVYFVPGFTECNPADSAMAGGAISKSSWAAGCGMIMTPAFANDGHVLGHELGHMLELDHPNQNSAGTDIYDNIDVYRRLMYAYTDLPASPGYRSNVGYGALKPGDQLTERNKTQDPRDRDWYDTRSHAYNPY